jgi:hypothetical protein
LCGGAVLALVGFLAIGLVESVLGTILMCGLYLYAAHGEIAETLDRSKVERAF